MDQKNFKYLCDITWDEVFENWRKREGTREEWQRCAREVKGWPDWESWRKFSSELFGAKNRNWKLYEILFPNKTIPNFAIGPWNGWQKHFVKKNKHIFADLVRDHYEWVNSNEKIKQILTNFPDSTEMIGIAIEKSDKIVLFEGSHRAAAVALANQNSQPIKFKSNPLIAVTEIDFSEKKILDKMIKRGSSKYC